MSNPGAEALQALINYSNEITGESNTTLSDAVESLVAGYGQGGGAETVTVTETATNTHQCMENIFGTPEPGYLYAALLTGKPNETWATDQFVGGIGAAYTTTAGFYGTSMRYRNSNISQANIATNYDAKVEIGDVFTILKIPYS